MGLWSMDEVNWKDSYEAARIELKRAEVWVFATVFLHSPLFHKKRSASHSSYSCMQTLLKERHVNTKKVLVKQKKLAEELAKEKEKRKGAEKKSAAAARYVMPCDRSCKM